MADVAQSLPAPKTRHNTAAEQAPTDTRYCRTSLRKVSDRFPVTLSTRSGQLIALDLVTADVLWNISGFKTLTTHVEEVLSRMGLLKLQEGHEASTDFRTVTNSLQRLVDVGVIISEAEWLRQMRDAAAKDSSPPAVQLKTIAVVTKDRPLHLARSLDSILKGVYAAGREARVCVYDDSGEDKSPVVQNSCEMTLRTSLAQVRYFGAREKRHRLRDLQLAGEVDPDVLRFALSSEQGELATYGANLNWVLLDNIGEMVCCMDDDILAKPSAFGEQSPGLSLTSAVPFQTWIYKTRADATRHVEPSDLDVLTAHEGLLGQTVSECVTNCGAQECVDLASIGPEFAFALANNGGKVAATMLGLFGESGTSQPWTCLAGPSLIRLRAEAAADRALLGSREVIRTVLQATICEHPFFMNGACGLDNRSLLPPFLPVCRNMDGVFAVTLRRCFPGYYFGYLPWIVPHDPPPGPQSRNPQGPRLSDLLYTAISLFQFEANSFDVAANLRMLGRHLSHLGCLPLREFESCMRHFACVFTLARLRHVEELLDESQESKGPWREYCEADASRLKEVIASLCDPSAAELRRTTDSGSALGETRRVVQLFGKLLVCWPDIVQMVRNRGGLNPGGRGWGDAT